LTEKNSLIPGNAAINVPNSEESDLEWMQEFAASVLQPVLQVRKKHVRVYKSINDGK
jgi:hypothetical protein